MPDGRSASTRALSADAKGVSFRSARWRERTSGEAVRSTGMRIHIRHLLPLFLLTLTPVARAQYNDEAGANAPAAVMEERVVHDAKTGKDRVEQVRREAPRDSWGNAQGSQHDLAVDGAFEGQ